MGGFGSGCSDHWWRPEKKTVVEACHRLDANRWRREGILRAGIRRRGTWVWWTDATQAEGAADIAYEVDTAADLPTVRLSYKFAKFGDKIDYPVRLVTTRPHFGGQRFWFVCPISVNGVACGRRVGKLYLPPGGKYFACRHCYDLSYTSSQESGKAESMARGMVRSLGCTFAEAMKIFRPGCRRRC